jgi:hypothetical protein
MNTSKYSLPNLSLLALTLFYIIMLGGGNYEQMNVTPVIASAPPKSLYMLQGEYGFSPVKFWATFRPITILLFIITLALNWKNSRKSLLITAFLIDIATTVATFTYFAPETEVFVSAAYHVNAPVDSVVFQKAQLWKNLNYLRLAAFYVAAVILLMTVSRHGNKDKGVIA